jgi:hypothetical protein
LTVRYFAVKTAAGWRLGSPLHILTEKWPTMTTTYFTIHYADKSLISDVASRKLDDFVRTAGKALGFTAADFDRLVKAKIDYYLCPADMVERLTGYKTEGMADLPMDAVVTRHPLHEHEIAHLLVNYALKEVPLYTLPFIQEGTACCLGGRWSKAPEVVFYAGYMAWNFQLLELDELLTREGFNTTIGSADISYPAAALLTAYLRKDLSPEQFGKLYESLSGTGPWVRSLAIDTVKAIISRATGNPWDSLKAGFKSYYEDRQAAGITPIKDTLSTKPALIITSEGSSVRIWQETSGYQVAVTGSGKGEGYIVLQKLSGENKSSFVSRLFTEQMPGEKYAGEDFGIRYSTGELAVYDYRTDRLVAIYLPAVSEVDSTMQSSTARLTFRIDRDVMDSLEVADCSARLVQLK